MRPIHRPKSSGPHKLVAPPPKNPPESQISLCVIFKDNIDTLQALLESVDGHFDEYVFTDTGSSDGSRELVQAFLQRRQGKITDFTWCDDFAKARQANFEAATKPWRFFLDSDDVLKVGTTPLQSLIQKGMPHGIQGIFVAYDYAVDEDLHTMRCVRWDFGWRWQDAIHERLVATGDVEPKFAQLQDKDCLVLHKRKTAEEKTKALRRNTEIAKREYAVATDPEYKARLARTIAMTCKIDNDIDGAEKLLIEVAHGYPHLPEGRQAFADLSRIYAMRGDWERSLEEAAQAGPSYEAIIHHSMENYEKCLQRYNAGMNMGPQTTHEGFLFEKCVAPVLAADAAIRLGYPVSVAEQILNRIRPDLRNHELVGEYTSSIRAFSDRITILVPGTPQPFDGSSTNAMLGGSEEAVVYLCRALAKQGRNVRVFGILPAWNTPGVDKDGVDYQPFERFNVNDEHGTLVIWRAVGLLAHLVDTRIDIDRRIEAGDESAIQPTGIGRSSLWLHDQSLGVGDPRMAQALLRSVDSVIVLSDHHQKMIERELPEDHKVNFVKLSNGIVGEDFRDLDWSQRDYDRVVYSSCPSRGLLVLLDMWPQVKHEVPTAKLDIYYDWAGVKNNQPELYKQLVHKYQSVRGLDVVHHGGVGHDELHKALAGANVWAYSHFHNPNVETFAISSVKAQAAGATVLTVPNGALPEVVPEAHFAETPEDYLDDLICLLKRPRGDEERQEISELAIERFDWAEVAKRFGSEWTTLS